MRERVRGEEGKKKESRDRSVNENRRSITARVDGVPERKKREETVTIDNVGTFICMHVQHDQN